MIRELLLPLGVDTQGRLSTVSDPVARAQQHLLTYLMTAVGERVMRPSFGTESNRFLFDNLDSVDTALLNTRIAVKVKADVSDVVLRDIQVGTTYEDGRLDVTVLFSLAVGIGAGVVQSTILTLGGTL